MIVTLALVDFKLCHEDNGVSNFFLGVFKTRRNATLRYFYGYFYGKRSYFYEKWSVNLLITIVFMYLSQKDVLPDSN